MLKSSIKQMTMSVVCIVMCLIVTTAFANPEESNDGKTVQKRYSNDACDGTSVREEFMEGCTLMIDPNDACRQWTECTRSSGNLWNERDLCETTLWASYQTLTRGNNFERMIEEDARGDISVNVIDNDPSLSGSQSHSNLNLGSGFGLVSRFLKGQELTTSSFMVDVTIHNCARFMTEG